MIANPNEPPLMADAGESPTPFGVGCFYFSYLRPPPFNLSASEFAQALRRRLESLGTLTNISVAIDETGEYEIDAEEPQEIDQEDDIFPWLQSGTIEFDVFIPARIQDEITEKGTAVALGTEHFRVQINFQYFGPVAFVLPLNAPRCDHPADAVRVVREFLEREINIADQPIRFRFVGPSPFHGEFFLEAVDAFAEDSDAWLFDRERLLLFGYADFHFRYEKVAFDDPEDALGILFDELGSELSFYYAIVRHGNRLHREWRAISETVAELTADRMPNWRSALRARITRGQALRRVHKMLAHFEAKLILGRSDRSRELAEVYENDRLPMVREDVESALAEIPEFPTTQIGRLISFESERRSKALELAVVVLASIVGGVAGSLLTLAVH